MPLRTRTAIGVCTRSCWNVAKTDLLLEALVKKLEGVETKIHDSAPPLLAKIDAPITFANTEATPQADDAAPA